MSETREQNDPLYRQARYFALAWHARALYYRGLNHSNTVVKLGVYSIIAIQVWSIISSYSDPYAYTTRLSHDTHTLEVAVLRFAFCVNSQEHQKAECSRKGSNSSESPIMEGPE